jgi:hypothetical protein
MSQYVNLLKNIEKLQNLGFKSEFDLSPYLLPVEEVVKNLLKQKNPNMSLIDIDLMIDSEDISLSKMIKEVDESFKKRTVNSTVGPGQTKKLTPEEKARIKEREKLEKEKIKEIRKERIKKNKEIYKDKVVELKNQAKQITKEIKIAFYNLVREAKVILRKSIAAFIQTGSSLSAISIIIAAPPWNIPLAISYTMAVVDILLNLISQLKSIIPYTTIFDQLHFVVDPKNLTILSNILNSTITPVIELWSKLTAFETLIKGLLDFILSLISGSNKQKIFKKVRSKLRKLGNFNDSNKTFNIEGKNIRANSEDDAAEVKDLLDTYKVDYGKKSVTGYKDEANNSTETENLLNKLKTDVNKSQNIKIPRIVEESFIDTYEVILPDGKTLRNQTEKDLEELRKVYKLVAEQVSEIQTR